MRFLVLTNNDVGLYNFRKELLRRLLSDGNEVYISLPYGKKVKLLEDMGCKFIEIGVDRRGKNPLADICLLFEYMRLISRIKPEKVITYTIKPNIYGCFACRIKGVDAYANVTGLGTAFQGAGLLTSLVTLMYKAAFKKVKRVFFENEENRDIIVGKGIVNKKRTQCLNGAGVDLEEFSYAEYPIIGTTRFLFIGRVMKEKGIDELLEVAVRLKRDDEDIDVEIVGSFEDHYEKKIKELDETGIIKYHGYQNDVKPFIKQAHCFVLPSYHEGMANTLLESAAMGRPLITSNIHGCLESVKDGVTGYLCNVKDTEDLYIKMKQFIKLPYDDKKKMGWLSHKYVASVFDKKKVVEETVKGIMG